MATYATKLIRRVFTTRHRWLGFISKRSQWQL